MLTRRHWLTTAAALTAALLVARSAPAAQPLEVAVPSNAVGAIVVAVGGAAVTIKLDRGLGPAQLKIDGKPVDVTDGLRIQQPSYLDDPRNAPKLGASVRKALAAARPELAAEFDANHKAWTRPFVRKVLAWNARLATSPVRGKRVADTHARATLLEWAGATVDPAGQPSPAALARAPKDAAAATLDSYVAYVDALVLALA